MPEMTQAQFDVVAELLRSREPVKSAVCLVMVGGGTAKEAADQLSLVPQAVNNAVRRYRNAHKKLLSAYISA